MRPLGVDNPRFKSEKPFKVDFENTTDSTRVSRQTLSRNDGLLERGVEQTHMAEDDFRQFHGQMMQVLHSQNQFRCVAVGKPDEADQCEITLHNGVPQLHENEFESEDCSVVGRYHIPGIKKDFPGAVVTTRTMIFGDPAEAQNQEEYAHLQKARKPKAGLRNK